MTTTEIDNQTLAESREDMATRLFAHSRQPLVAAVLRQQSLGVGEFAPDFELPNCRGGRISLEAMLARGPVMLAFRHGAWCDACAAEGRSLLPLLGDLAARDISVAMIAPTCLPDFGHEDPRLDCLVDGAGHVAGLYGIMIHLPPDLAMLARRAGLPLPYTEDNDIGLPVPGLFSIEQNGLVSRALVDPDHSQRNSFHSVIQDLASAAD